MASKVAEFVLHKALCNAVQIIRDWHGMRMPREAEDLVWKIYWSHSPELKLIREALEGDPTHPPSQMIPGPTGPTGPGKEERGA